MYSVALHGQADDGRHVMQKKSWRFPPDVRV